MFEVDVEIIVRWKLKA